MSLRKPLTRKQREKKRVEAMERWRLSQATKTSKARTPTRRALRARTRQEALREHLRRQHEIMGDKLWEKVGLKVLA